MDSDKILQESKKRNHQSVQGVIGGNMGGQDSASSLSSVNIEETRRANQQSANNASSSGGFGRQNSKFQSNLEQVKKQNQESSKKKHGSF